MCISLRVEVQPYEKHYFHHEGTKDTKVSDNITSELRALRGEIILPANSIIQFDQEVIMSLKLSGILSANVTPFKDNYNLDEAGLRKLIRYQAKPAGINAIVCNAGAGEGATLTREERVRCIEIIREEIRPEQCIVAGIEA